MNDEDATYDLERDWDNEDDESIFDPELDNSDDAFGREDD